MQHLQMVGAEGKGNRLNENCAVLSGVILEEPELELAYFE